MMKWTCALVVAGREWLQAVPHGSRLYFDFLFELIDAARLMKAVLNKVVRFRQNLEKHVLNNEVRQ